MVKQGVRCLVYMSASEATLGEDCVTHQKFTHEDLVLIRDTPAPDKFGLKRRP